MKKFLLTALAFCTAFAAAAQTPAATEPEGYRFTDVRLIPMTPVKDQHRSGTCWCYSTLSFLEGEILRAGGRPVHLSEMWIVAHYSLNIFSEIPFYRLSLYISYLLMFSFGLNTHEISRF